MSDAQFKYQVVENIMSDGPSRFTPLISGVIFEDGIWAPLSPATLSMDEAMDVIDMHRGRTKVIKRVYHDV